MEAKDTVMSDEVMGNLLDLEIEFTYPCSDGSQTTTVDCHKLAKAQAEISFRAGIEEVVEWINSRDDMELVSRAFWEEEWQDKLKEWGTER